MPLTAEQQKQNNIDQNNKKLEIESKLAAIQRELNQKTSSSKKMSQKAKSDLNKSKNSEAATTAKSQAAAATAEGEKKKDMKT